MADSDDDVEIITPTKRLKRSYIDDEDNEEQNVVALSQQTDEEIVMTSKNKQQKRTVVLDDTDEDETKEPDDAMANFRASTPRRENGAPSARSTPNRRHSMPALNTPRSSTNRRASRRLSDRGAQKEIEHIELKQKLKRKSLETCLPPRKPASEDEFVGESDDSDAFVVDDDVVEYMEEDEKPVLAVDDDGEDDDIEMAMRGSKDPMDWFCIYLTYIEECLLNSTFETDPAIPAVFKHSIEHVERGLLQRRDSLRGNVHWPSDLVESIDTMPQAVEGEGDGDRDCYACNRSGHPAHYAIIFTGVACNATDMYRRGWRQHLMACLEADNRTRVEYDLGSLCFQRVLLYWSLHQAKRQWCNIVWRKIVESGNGPIPSDVREKLHKVEYGRYKKLLGMVDGMELKESHVSRIGNVWANVRQITIESMADPHDEGGRRRGDVAALVNDENLVGESSEDDDEDRLVDEEENVDEPARRQSPPKPAPQKERTQETAAGTSPQDANRCLVCNARPRTGGVLHGYYVHIYCCFECAKSLKEKKKPCAVCSRPMERVIHLLQLNDEEEVRIRATHASSCR
ncbi:hypothetical protein H310_13441 [Aphanomyces invadans]|uniref:DUF4211 domain-containing protein n=1 Tax=Aphanomyces invadans TaxID=157072 RepID=A0A024TDS7_9STRA|nr:hypothetical protein H310_13441 [Aphanomyces invadans]ETV92208.1 hypothetical protein H310_13441 [Aphanomyces invadans]|eukprot:XP_008879172.1 hypothetical protein H310_13441 [Aphanomyces invadans]